MNTQFEEIQRIKDKWALGKIDKTVQEWKQGFLKINNLRILSIITWRLQEMEEGTSVVKDSIEGIDTCPKIRLNLINILKDERGKRLSTIKVKTIRTKPVPSGLQFCPVSIWFLCTSPTPQSQPVSQVVCSNQGHMCDLTLILAQAGTYMEPRAYRTYSNCKIHICLPVCAPVPLQHYTVWQSPRWSSGIRDIVFLSPRRCAVSWEIGNLLSPGKSQPTIQRKPCLPPRTTVLNNVTELLILPRR